MEYNQLEIGQRSTKRGPSKSDLALRTLQCSSQSACPILFAVSSVIFSERNPSTILHGQVTRAEKLVASEHHADLLMRAWKVSTVGWPRMSGRKWKDGKNLSSQTWLGSPRCPSPRHCLTTRSSVWTRDNVQTGGSTRTAYKNLLSLNVIFQLNASCAYWGMARKDAHPEIPPQDISKYPIYCLLSASTQSILCWLLSEQHTDYQDRWPCNC